MFQFDKSHVEDAYIFQNELCDRRFKWFSMKILFQSCSKPSFFLLHELMYSNFKNVYTHSWFPHTQYSPQHLYFKPQHNPPFLENHYHGRFEKANSNSSYLNFYICIHISINRIGVVISYTSICPPFLFVHINCIMKRIKNINGVFN